MRTERSEGRDVAYANVITFISFLSTSALWNLTWNSHAVTMTDASVPDRGRIVRAREKRNAAEVNMNSRVVSQRSSSTLPIEGPRYRGKKRHNAAREIERRRQAIADAERQERLSNVRNRPPSGVKTNPVRDPETLAQPVAQGESEDEIGRDLSSQLTGCCNTYQGYSAASMCELYGQDCTQGGGKSHDSGDENCITDGLSFIGISFSVNTGHGNPYSYQLCDQYPMENIIDRNYDYIMSMDEDGWLVGGGYKQFDYSGKMPYIDSSHTELLRIGQLDPRKGGTTIEQVYTAMNYISFSPFSIFPEYVKGGGGGHSDDDDEGGSVPSGDVTLIVSVAETYTENGGYSDYENFLDNLFNAMDAVGGGPCMDDHDTDPHVSMARGVKFKSSYHQYQYFYTVNMEVAVWQKMYPKGVVIGSKSSQSFPPNSRSKAQHIGYGNLYFFFDRANITKAFAPMRELSSSEEYYSTLMTTSSEETIQGFYSSVTYIPFKWNKKSGSGASEDKEMEAYEHNPYNWKSSMAIHDMTDGWDLPPNCGQEGETFFGIPLATESESKLQSTSTFQDQFDFDVLCDHNYTYIQDFGTNHGWLLGERVGNGVASIVDKDTAHIPLFYMGTTNANKGGMSLSKMIKVAKLIDFGTLYLKPAFVFADENGHVKLQFEADANSAIGYLYDNMCKMLGISWNYNKPSNDYGFYSSCVMHAAGDRAAYGCGPENANTGGFCPQMTIAYRAKFQSDDHAAAYMKRCNNYVDYWRSMYPNGVAVGSTDFCPDGGCLALFLNRMDIYQVFEPEQGGSWVYFNGASMSPTVSPAPTWHGGCDDPHNMHLDSCFRMHAKPKQSYTAWTSLGPVGQMCVVLVTFMATTLAFSVFLVRARRRKKRNESYLDFVLRDYGPGVTKPKKLKKKKKNRKSRSKNSSELEEEMLDDDLYNDEFNPESRPRPAKAKRNRSRSRSTKPKGRSKSRGKSQVPEQDEETGRKRRVRSRSRSRGGSRSSRGSSKASSSKRSASRRREEQQIQAPPEEPRRQLV